MPDKQRRGNTARRRSIRRDEPTPTPSPSVFQALEPRALMSVSTDAAGWTVVAPADDTRVIYVSSRYGNDSNGGLSESSAVRTLGKAQQLVREGSADWLLLRRGDTFDTFGDWRKSGRSASEPIYIGAYGSGGDRPQIDSGTGPGFITYQRNASSINNVVIQSIAFRAHTYNHFNGSGITAGIRLTSRGSNWIIEDVRVEGYKDNIVFDAASGTLRNLTLRRSIVIDAHADEGMSNGKAQGLYIGPNSDGIYVRENVFDHNGWRRGRNDDRIVYNHNTYSKNGARNVVVENNIISQGSFYGLKFNSGGIARGNLFIRNSESIYLEEPATIEGNVITEAVDMPHLPWGVGINTQKASRATIRDNLIVHSSSGRGGPSAGIQLFNNGTPFRGVVEGNIVYNWRHGLIVQTRGDGSDSVVIRGNHFQVPGDVNAVQHMSSAPLSAFVYENNIYSAGGRSEANKLNGSTQDLGEWTSRTGEAGAKYQTVNYPDPGRTIARYNAEAAGGEGSFEDFIDGARQTRRGAWNPAYTAGAVNAWFSRGFGVGGSGGSNNNSGGNTGNTGGQNGNGGTTPQPQPTAPAGPRVNSAVLNVDQLPNALHLKFNANVSGSIGRGDITVVDLRTGAKVPVRAVYYVKDKNLAKFVLAELPDGQYRATLRAGSVADERGIGLQKDQAWDFYVLAGDANRDRRVNTADFAVAAAHYLSRRATFTQGDFDYSGRVDGDDVDAVIARFQMKVITSTAVTQDRAPARVSAPAAAKPQSTAAPVFMDGDGDDLKRLI